MNVNADRCDLSSVPVSVLKGTNSLQDVNHRTPQGTVPPQAFKTQGVVGCSWGADPRRSDVTTSTKRACESRKIKRFEHRKSSVLNGGFSTAFSAITSVPASIVFNFLITPTCTYVAFLTRYRGGEADSTCMLPSMTYTFEER